jgi:hypothetical protein
MKKIIIICVVLLAIAGYLLEFTNISNYLASHFTSSSSLSVSEEKGVDLVSVDGKQIGKTPITNYSLSAGSHEIVLTKQTNPSDYIKIDKTFIFESGTKNVITVELGPSLTYSFYDFLIYKKEVQGSYLYVNADEYAAGGMISVNGKIIQNTAIVSKTPGTYQVSYQHDGYIGETHQVQILSGYLLTDTIHLFKKPI